MTRYCCNNTKTEIKKIYKDMVPSKNEMPWSVRRWFKNAQKIKVKPHIHVLRSEGATIIILPGNSCLDQCADVITAVSEWDWLYNPHMEEPYYGF